jgi:hypothetical protein
MKRQLSTAAEAAKQIRAKLKAQGISARVRSENYAGGNSINVDLVDELPATVKAIESFCSQFQYGHFDGMQDLYEYSNRNDDIPQVKYLFVNVKYSSDTQQAALDYCLTHYADFAEVPSKYEEAKDQYLPGSDTWVSQYIWKILNGTKDSRFWSSLKPRQKAA